MAKSFQRVDIRNAAGNMLLFVAGLQRFPRANSRLCESAISNDTPRESMITRLDADHRSRPGFEFDDFEMKPGPI